MNGIIFQDIARGNGRDLSPKQEEEIRRVLNKQAEEARYKSAIKIKQFGKLMFCIYGLGSWTRPTA